MVQWELMARTITTHTAKEEQMRSAPSGHRTDVHTKRHFDPKDYEVIAYVYVQRGQVGTPAWVSELPAALRSDVVEELMHLTPNRQRESLRTYWPDFKVPGTDTGAVDRCAHCGLLISHIAVALHKPTGTHVPLGLDCAERAHMGSKAELIAKSNGRTREELQLTSLKTSLERQAGDGYSEYMNRRGSRETGSANRRARELCRAMNFWVRDDAFEMAAELDGYRGGNYAITRAARLLRWTGYLYSGTARHVAALLAAEKNAASAPKPAPGATVRGTVRRSGTGKLFVNTPQGVRVLVSGLGKSTLKTGDQVALRGKLVFTDPTDKNFAILKSPELLPSAPAPAGPGAGTAKYDVWVNHTKVTTMADPAKAVEYAKQVYGKAGATHAAVYTTDGDLVIELDA